jgi:hypothetical protein
VWNCAAKPRYRRNTAVRTKSKPGKWVKRGHAPAPGAAKRTIFGLTWPVLVPLALMCLAVLLIMAARVRLLEVPLERDEGEYAYIGQLMLQGVAPYGVAANMKLPGTYAAYALLMAIFGQTTSGIHFGFLLVNAGTVVLVFFLAKKLFGGAAGVSAAAAYAVLSVGGGVMGLWAHATNFVVLPALGATLLLLKWVDRRSVLTLISSGLLFGIAFLMKQPGILFALFGGLYLVYTQRKVLRSNGPSVLRNLVLFGAAVFLPFGVTCLLLWRAGVFPQFWFWVFTYARAYASIRPFSAAVSAFRSTAAPIAKNNLGICLLAVAGLLLLFRAGRNRTSAVMVTGFLVFSFLAICPGLYFREHYYILLLPAVALLIGAVAATAKETVAKALPLWLIAGALAYSLWCQGDFLFRMSPGEASRFVYHLNPFQEAIKLADYIRDRSKSDDRLVVLGSEPEIYFYTARRSVTPYVYVYPMTEPQPYASRMQAQFIHDVETNKPKYLVYVNLDFYWLVQQGSATSFLTWIASYCQRYYDRVGVADIGSHETYYQWDAAARIYQPRTHNFIVIFKRKGSGGS